MLITRKKCMKDKNNILVVAFSRFILHGKMIVPNLWRIISQHEQIIGDLTFFLKLISIKKPMLPFENNHFILIEMA